MEVNIYQSWPDQWIWVEHMQDMKLKNSFRSDFGQIKCQQKNVHTDDLKISDLYMQAWKEDKRANLLSLFSTVYAVTCVDFQLELTCYTADKTI